MKSSKENLVQTKVLIVDDTPQNIDVLYRMLSAKNYSVSGVPSGKLALEVVGKFNPDVILLDIMMPGMNGFETCTELKSNPLTAKIPVIFITAKNDAADIAQGFQVGGADYILKPAREEEVWARVGHQIELKKLLEHKNRLIEQLNQTEKRNREVIDRASDPILIVSPQGLIESANPAAIQMLKYSGFELIGRSFVQLLEKKSQEKYEACFSQEPETFSKCNVIGKGPSEISVKDKVGTIIPVDLSVSQIGYKSPKFLCLIHDLSIHHNLVQQLRHLTLIDKLTGLANRRKLDDFYNNEWYRCLRNRKELSVLFIDIDFFKNYNDAYGHQAGDNCLKIVSSVLESKISRHSDLIARYGGEEFVAVLPETEYVGALEVAEQIRSQIEKSQQEHQGSEISDYVTVSIGVGCCIPDEHFDSDKLLKLADQALYQAKEKGRNQVHGEQL